jgi:membrane-bound ClpP family serine protease
MLLKQAFPLIVSVFIIVVGLFFLSSTVLGVDLLTPQDGGRLALSVIALVFIASGLLFIFLYQRGRLKKKGKTVHEVRREAVAKLDSEQLLSDIALKDPVPEIREQAKERLKELNRS